MWGEEGVRVQERCVRGERNGGETQRIFVHRRHREIALGLAGFHDWGHKRGEPFLESKHHHRHKGKNRLITPTLKRKFKTSAAYEVMATKHR